MNLSELFKQYSPFRMHPGNIALAPLGARHPYLPPPMNIGVSAYDALREAMGRVDMDAVRRYSPFQLMPQNQFLGALGATHGYLPPPMNAMVSAGEAIYNRFNPRQAPMPAGLDNLNPSVGRSEGCSSPFTCGPGALLNLFRGR